MVNSGDVSVPVAASWSRKVLTSPLPRNPVTSCWSPMVPVAGAVPKASPVAVQLAVGAALEVGEHRAATGAGAVEDRVRVVRVVAAADEEVQVRRA